MLNPTCKYAYEKNNHARFIERDIRKFTGTELLEMFPWGDIKLLVGCAPCQPFSVLPKNRKEPGDKDERWRLLDDFGRLIQEVEPELVAFENITPIRKVQVFTDFVEKLDFLGYEYNSEMVYCPNHGVPQKRRRLVLIASRLGKVDLLRKTHTYRPKSGLKPFVTVRETIENLPPIGAGEVSNEDLLHRANNLTDINKERIRQSKPGGTWLDWDEDLRAPCHQKPSGQTYTSVYGRMKWDEPSPTITTQFSNFGSGRFGHPTQDRALSIREGALLQTFPQDYRFMAQDSAVSIAKLGIYIGNAVPVRLATVIGQHIQKHVEKSGYESPQVYDDY